MKKRCFSKCRKIKEKDCKPPCFFVANKYCRLSSKLKMKGPDCVIVKKKTKKSIKKEAIQKIKDFMKRTEGKRKSLFLKEMCADSGLCLTFGKEKDKIKDFFDFNTFTYAKFPTKTIGEPSQNGFIKEIKYERENYHAYAILKSAKTNVTDNLAYEYLVGEYINKQTKKFPVFIETYGLFNYKSSIERTDHFNKNELTSQLVVLDPNDISNVCKKSSTECILIQHFKDVTTLFKMSSSIRFFVYESPYVFYNIFFALYKLRKEFTHYDLHTNNVLIFEPVKGKHIDYHYHLPNETIVFSSKYIVKLIDYGRSHFKGSADFYEKIEKESQCKENGNLLYSFSYLRKLRLKDAFYYFINSYYKNESHDIRILHGYSQKIDLDTIKQERMQDYIDIFKNIVYENKEYPNYSAYGTKEDLNHDEKIRNVTDVEKRLRKWILEKVNIDANRTQYISSNKLGEFHIYSDGKDMEYKPV